MNCAPESVDSAQSTRVFRLIGRLNVCFGQVKTAYGDIEAILSDQFMFAALMVAEQQLDLHQLNCNCLWYEQFCSNTIKGYQK